MGLFGVLLKAVPWGALLANGPGIARAAEGLLARSRAADEAARQKTGDELRALTERAASLEANQLEMSELIRRMADQTQRLAESADVLAVRMRWLLGVAVVAGVLAIVAIVLTVW